MTTLNQAGNPILNLQRDVDDFTRAYIECALWSSTLPPFSTCPACGEHSKVLDRWLPASDEVQYPVYVCRKCSEKDPPHEPPADENYSWTDLANETLAKIVEDCAKFQKDNASDLAAFAPSDAQNGHDFWLSRNGHGAGFFDRDCEPHAEDIRDRLQDAARACGEVNLIVGDDGKIYA